jgi:citrate lyase subunit beta/citryl-CoA lyase
MTLSLPRSYLFVPGNRPERFQKAYDAGADAVILDLEDAVAPPDKRAARNFMTQWISRERPVLIRINPVDSEWFADDVQLSRLPGIAGVLLPKTQNAEYVRSLLACLPASLPVLPLIETAEGFWNAHSIARISGVQRIVFGTVDFGLDVGISDPELLYFRSQLVLVSRLAGIAAPVDGVSTRIEAVTELRSDTLRARALGFGGKLCIHPHQIDIVNRCFLPTPEELAWAHRIVEAAAASGGSAIAVAGEMVDRPAIERARAMLALPPG